MDISAPATPATATQSTSTVRTETNLSVVIFTIYEKMTTSERRVSIKKMCSCGILGQIEF